MRSLREGPLPIWTNFRQRALIPAMAEINAKMDREIAIESINRGFALSTARRTVKAAHKALKENSGEYPVL